MTECSLCKGTKQAPESGVWNLWLITPPKLSLASFQMGQATPDLCTTLQGCWAQDLQYQLTAFFMRKEQNRRTIGFDQEEENVNCFDAFGLTSQSRYKTITVSYTLHPNHHLDLSHIFP